VLDDEHRLIGSAGNAEFVKHVQYDVINYDSPKGWGFPQKTCILADMM